MAVLWGGGGGAILGVKLVLKLNISLFLEDGLFFFFKFLLLFFWVMGDTKEGSFFSFGVWGPQIGKLSFLSVFGGAVFWYGDLKLVN